MQPNAPATPPAAGPAGGPPSLEQIKAQRQEQLAAENKLLDQLHHSVMTTRDSARMMGTELDEHDQMLTQLGSNVERANQETTSQTRGISRLIEQSSGKGFYLTVGVLVLIIIVLLLL